LKDFDRLEHVFKFFKEINLDEAILKKLLLEKDKEGETFLFVQNGSKPRLLKALSGIVSKNVLREILISRNKQNDNFLINIKSDDEFKETIDFIKEIFPNDLLLFLSRLERIRAGTRRAKGVRKHRRQWRRHIKNKRRQYKNEHSEVI
jgi:hypothetical protein